MTEKLVFMRLNFPIMKIKPKSKLGEKLARLGLTPTVDRIFTKLILFDGKSEVIFKGDCIIDTGATLSLLPGSILKYYKDLQTEDHVIWGMINKEECKIDVKIGLVNIQLQDPTDNISPIIKIPIAFTYKIKVPNLLGMKSILADFNYSFDKDKQKFSIFF